MKVAFSLLMLMALAQLPIVAPMPLVHAAEVVASTVEQTHTHEASTYHCADMEQGSSEMTGMAAMHAADDGHMHHEDTSSSGNKGGCCSPSFHFCCTAVLALDTPAVLTVPPMDSATVFPMVLLEAEQNIPQGLYRPPLA